MTPSSYTFFDISENSIALSPPPLNSAHNFHVDHLLKKFVIHFRAELSKHYFI